MLVSGGFPMFSQQPSGIKAKVVVKEMFDQGDDVWPDNFASAPQRGDTVQSDKGRRLSVLDVVHLVQNGAPIIQVEIGVDRTTSTPIEGGGGNLL